jgi:hypothetical protein
MMPYTLNVKIDSFSLASVLSSVYLLLCMHIGKVKQKSE